MTSPTTVKERLPAVDALRGLAILMITGFHLGRLPTEPLPFVGPILAAAISGVALFFTVSGFCLYLLVAQGKTLPPPGEFYRRRLARIVPPYYVAVLLWLPLWAITPSNHEGWAHWPRNLLAHLTFTHTFSTATMYTINGVLWFMGPLILLYLGFPLLARVSPFFLLGGALLVRAPIEFLVSPALHTVTRSALVQAAPFAAGMAAARLYVRGNGREWWSLLLGLGLAQVVLAPLVPGYAAVPGIHLVRTLGWGCLVLGAMWCPWPGPAPLRWLGRISYSVFLYNYLVYWIPRWLFPSLAVGSGLWWLLTPASLFAAALLLYFLFERPVWLPLVRRRLSPAPASSPFSP